MSKVLKGAVSGFDVWTKVAKNKEITTENGLEEFCMITWSIWKARNSALFEQRITSEKDIFETALSYLKEFQMSSTAASSIIPEERTTQNRWKPPAEGQYKVNVDGAFKEGKAGVGVVIRDTVGDLIATMAAPVPGVQDPQFLEAVAIAKGIELANDIALTGYSIESDCLEVVSKVKNEYGQG